MVYINNNNEIKIYNLDDFDSIINRIAVDMKTLPELLYFPDGIPTTDDFMNNENIKVENLTIDIENSTSFTELYEIIQIKENGRVKLDKKNILKYYILLNKKFDAEYNLLSEYESNMYLKDLLNKDVNDDVNGEKITMDFMDPIILRRENFINDFLGDIKKIINDWNDDSDNLKNFKEFENKKGVKYTEFLLEKTSFSFEIKLNKIHRMEVEIIFFMLYSFFNLVR